MEKCNSSVLVLKSPVTFERTSSAKILSSRKSCERKQDLFEGTNVGEELKSFFGSFV